MSKTCLKLKIAEFTELMFNTEIWNSRLDFSKKSEMNQA